MLQITEKLDQGMAGSLAKLAEHHRHFTDLTDGIRNDLSATASDVVTRTKQLSTDIDENRSACDSACSAIDTKFSQRCQAQDDVIERQHQHFVEACLDIDQKFVGCNTAQSERMDELSRAIQDDHANLTSACKTTHNFCSEQITLLKALISKKADELSAAGAKSESSLREILQHHSLELDSVRAALQEAERSLSSRCEALDAKVDRANGIQDERAQRQYEHFVGKLGDLDSKIDEDSTRQDSRTDDLGRMLQKKLDTLQVELRELEAATTAKNATQDERMQRIHTHFTDANTELDRKFGERMDSHHHHMAGVSRAVDQKLSERAASQEERTKELSEAVQQNQRDFTTVSGNIERHFTSVCADIVSKFTDEITIRDERIEDQHNHFANSCASISSKLSDAVDTAQTRSDQLRSHFSALCTELDTKLTKTTQDLDKSIQTNTQQVTAVCSELAANQKAADTILEARLEELSHGISENRQHFDTTSAKLMASIDGNYQQLTGACEVLDEKMTECASALDSRLQNQHQYFTDVCSNLDQKLVERNSAQNAKLENQRLQLIDVCDNLDRKFAEKCVLQERNLTQLADDVRKNREHFTSVCDSMDKAVTARAESQDERMIVLSDAIKENHQHFTDVCKTMNSKFTDENVSITERIEDHFKHFTNVCSKLDEQASEKNNAQDAVADAHYQHFTQVTADITDRVSEQFSGHDTQLAELAKELESHHSHFTDVCASLDEKFTAENAKQDDRSEQQHSAMQTVFATLESRVDEQYSSTISQISATQSLCQEYRELGAADVSALGDKFAVTTTSIRDTLSTFAEKNASQDTRTDGMSSLVEQHHKHFTALCTDIESQLSADRLAHSERCEDDSKRILDVCASVDTRLTDRIDAHTSRMDKLQTTMMQHHELVTEAAGELNRRFKADMADLEELLQRNCQHLTERCVTADQSATDSKAAQDTRMDSLQIAIQSQHEHFTQVCNKVEHRFQEENAAQDQRAEQQHTHFSRVCDQLEKALAEHRQQHTVRMDEVNSSAQKNIELLTNSLSSMESKFTLKQEAQDTRMDDQQQLIRETAAVIDKKIDDKCASLNKQLADVTESVQEQGTHSQRMYTALEERTAEKLATSAAELKTRTRELNERCDDIDTAGQERAGILEARIEEVNSVVQEHHQHFANLCDNLDSKFTLKNATQDERIESQQQHFADKCSNLDQKFTEKDSSQDNRVDELSATMREHFDHFTAAIDKVTRKFSDANSTQDDRASRDHAHFTELCNTLESSLADKNSSQDARMDELAHSVSDQQTQQLAMHQQLDGKFTDTCMALQEKFSVQQQHIESVHADLSTTIADKHAIQVNGLTELGATVRVHHSKFADACDALDTKISEAIDKNEQRAELSAAELSSACAKLENSIQTQRHDLSERLDELSAQATAHFQQFTQDCQRLDTAIVEKSATLTSRIDHQEEHFAALCEDMDRDLRDLMATQRDDLRASCSDLHSKIAELGSRHSERMDEISSVALDHHRHFTALCGSIDQKFVHENQTQDENVKLQCARLTDLCAQHEKRLTEDSAKHAARTALLESAVDDNHRTLTSALAQVDTKFCQKYDDLSVTVASQHNHVTEVCEAIDAKFTSKCAAIDSTQNALSHSYDELHANVTSLVSDLDQKLTSADEVLAEHIDATSKDLSSSCDALEQNLTDSSAAYSEQLEALRMHAEELCSGIDDKHSNSAEAQTLRLAEITAELAVWRAESADTCADLDEKFMDKVSAYDERMDLVVDSLHEQRDHFTSIGAELDEKFTDKHAATDARASEFSAEALQSIDTLRSQISSGLQQQKHESSDANSQLERQLRGVSTKLEGLEAHFAEASALAEQKVAQEFSTQAALLETYQQQFSATCSSIDTKFSDENKAQQERTDSLHAHFSSVCADLAQKATDEVADVRDFASQKSTRLEAALNDAVLEHDRQVSATQQRIDTVRSDLARQFTEQDADLDEKLVGMCRQLDSKFAEIFEGHNSQFQKHCQQYADSVTILEETHATSVDSMNEKIKAQIEELEARTVSRSDALSAQHIVLKENVASQSLTFSDKLAKLGQLVDANKHHCLQEVVRIEKHVEGDMASQQEAGKQQHSHFTDVCERIQRSNTESCALLDSKFSDMCSSLDRKHTGAVTQQASLIATQADHFRDACARILEDTSTKCSSLESDIATSKDTLQARISALATAVPDLRQQLTSRLDSLQQEMNAANTAQDDVATNRHERSQAAVAAVDTKLVEQVAALDQKLNGTSVSQSERIAQVSTQLAADIAALSKALGSTEQRLLAKCDALSAESDDQERHFTDTSMALKAQLTTQINAVSDEVGSSIQMAQSAAIDHETRVADKLVVLQTSFDRELQERFGEVAQHLSNVQTRIDHEHQHFTDVASVLDKNHAEQHTDLEQNVTARLESIESECTRICQENTNSITEDHALFSSLCNKLDEKITASDKIIQQLGVVHAALVQEAKAELNDGIHQLREETRADYAELNRRRAEKDTTQDELIASNFRELSESCVAIGKATSEQLGIVEAKAEEQLRELRHLCEDNDKKASKATADLQIQLQGAHDDLDRDLRTQLTSLEDQQKMDMAQNATNQQTLDSKLSNMISEVGRSCADALAKQQTQQDTLSATVIDHHSHFSTVIAQLENKMVDANAAQSEQNEALDQQIASCVGKVDEKLSAETMALQERVAAKNSAQDERLDELSGTLEEHYQQFTETSSAADRRFAQEVDKIETRADSDHASLSKLVDNLDESMAQMRSQFEHNYAALASSNNKRLEAIHTEGQAQVSAVDERCTAVCAQLEDRMRTTATSHAERMDRLHAAAEEQSQDLQELVGTKVGSLDTKLEQAIDAQQRAIDTQQSAIDAYAHIPDAVSELESSLTTAIASQEQRLLTASQKSASSIDQLDEKIVSATSKFEEQLSTSAALQVERCDRLAAALEEKHTQWQNSFRDEQHARASKSSAQDSVIEDHYKHFVAVTTKLDANIHEGLSAVDERLEEDAAASREELHALAKQSSENMKGLDERLTGAQSRLEKRVAERTLIVDEKIESTVRTVTEQISRMDAQRSSELTTARSEFEDKCRALAAQVAERAAEIHSNFEHFEGALASMDSVVSAQNESLTQQLTAQHQHFSTQCEQLDSKIVQTTDALTQGLNAERAAREGSEVNIESQIASNKSHFTEVCGQLRTDLSSKTTEATSDRQRIAQHFTAANEALEKKMTELNVAQSDVIEAQHQHFGDVCGALDKKISEEVSLLDAKYVQLIDSLDNKMTQEISQATATADNDRARFSHAIEVLQNTIMQQHTELDEKLTGIAKGHDAAIAEVSGNLERHHAEFTNSLAALDSSVFERLASLDSTITTDREHFTQICEHLDEKLEQTAMELGQAIKDTDVALGARVDNVASTLQQMQEQLQTDLLSLDDKFSRVGKEHSEQLAALASKTSDAHAVIAKELNETTSRHEDRMNTMESSFLEVAKRLDEKCMNETAEVAQRLTDVCSKLNEKFTGQHMQLDAKLDSATTKLEDGINSVQLQIQQSCTDLQAFCTAGCAKLDAKLSDVGSALAQRVDDEHTFFTAGLERVDEWIQSEGSQLQQRIADTAGALDRKLSDQLDAQRDMINSTHKHCDDLVAKNDANFARALGSLDTKFADALSAVDTKSTEQFGTIQSQHELTVSRFEEQIKSLDAKLSDESATLLRACDSAAASASRQLETKWSEHQMALNTLRELLESTGERLGRGINETAEVLDSRYSDICGKLRSEHQALSQDMNNGQERLRLSCAALDKKIAGLSDQCGSKISNVDAKFSQLCGRGEERAQAIAAALESSSKQLDGKITETAVATSRLANELGSLDSNVTKEFSTLRGDFVHKMEAASSSLGGQLHALQQETGTAIADLQSHAAQSESQCKDLEEFARRNQQQCAELAASFDRYRRQTDDACSALESRHIDGAAQQERKHEEIQAKVAAVCEQLHDSVTSSVGDVERRLASALEEHAQRQKDVTSELGAKAEANERACNQLASTVDSVSSSSADSAAQLDRKFSDLGTRLNERVDMVHGEFRGEVASQVAPLRQDLVTMAKNWQQAVGDLESRLTRSVDALSQRTDDAVASGNENRGQFGEVAAALDNKLGDVTAAQAQRTQELEAAQQECSRGLEQLRQSLDSVEATAVADVKTQLSPVLRELSEAVDQDCKTLSARCDDLESQLAALR